MIASVSYVSHDKYDNTCLPLIIGYFTHQCRVFYQNRSKYVQYHLFCHTDVIIVSISILTKALL